MFTCRYRDTLKTNLVNYKKFDTLLSKFRVKHGVVKDFLDTQEKYVVRRPLLFPRPSVPTYFAAVLRSTLGLTPISPRTAAAQPLQRPSA
jgi:hypothetical protein